MFCTRLFSLYLTYVNAPKFVGKEMLAVSKKLFPKTLSRAPTHNFVLNYFLRENSLPRPTLHQGRTFGSRAGCFTPSFRKEAKTISSCFYSLEPSSRTESRTWFRNWVNFGPLEKVSKRQTKKCFDTSLLKRDLIQIHGTSNWCSVK